MPDTNSPRKRAATRLRESEALALRARGATVAGISAALGFSRRGTQLLPARALGKLDIPGGPELKRLSLERLDVLRVHLFTRFEGSTEDGRPPRVFKLQADLVSEPVGAVHAAEMYRAGVVAPVALEPHTRASIRAGLGDGDKARITLIDKTDEPRMRPNGTPIAIGQILRETLLLNRELSLTFSDPVAWKMGGGGSSQNGAH